MLAPVTLCGPHRRYRARAAACVLALLTVQAGRLAPVRAATPSGEGVMLERIAGGGLVAESVTALLQDRAGFVWIGTRDGLILYDGYSATLFEHDVANPHSISDNLVRTIYEDRQGNLWIGTNSGGLDRLDRATWSFEHFRHDSGDPQTISHDSVNVILEARDGGLWIGTQIGLNRFDAAVRRFTRFLSDPDDPASLSHDYVYALHEDPDGSLWIGTVGGGLDHFDPRRGLLRTFRHDPGDPNSLPDDKVFAIHPSQGGDLWLGTERGLTRFDRDEGTFSGVARGSSRRGADSGYLVTSLGAARDGTIWVGTWRDGLLAYDPAAGAWLPEPAAFAETFDEDARVVSLLVDRADDLWIGTWDSGLMRARRRPVATQMLGLAEGLGFEDATAVLEDRQGRLWVGTWGEGLYHGEAPGDGDTGHLRRCAAMANGSVLSLEQDRRGRVWAGTMSGLFRIDPATDEALAFEHTPGDSRGIGPGYVTALLEDSRGRLWVGVGGSGLHLLSADGEGFERFVNDPDDDATLSDDYISALDEDAEGTIWIGTRSGGLNALRRDSRAFVRFLPDPSDPASLSHHYVTSIHADEHGRLWVATAGGGVNLAESRDLERLAFRRFTEREGLLDNTVRAIAADDDGSLWLATGHGLSRLDTRTGTFVNFGEEDGLPTSGFNNGAAFAGAEGIFFGSAHGVLSVPRGTRFAAPDPAPTVLRSIRGLDRPIPAGVPAWSLERLEVPYGEVLSFEFAVLDFGDVGRHRFGYRLLGMRDSWVDLGNRREVTFTDLEPGRYTLSVRGRSARGVWSEGPVQLDLLVVPPFWMTTWFRLATLAVVGLTALTGHRIRTSRLERRNRELIALKEQREQALAEMRVSQEALRHTYRRLRSLTRRLELAKEDERKRIARELHDEMGQALTAAKINLQLLSSDPAQVGVAGRIEDTIGLVDRMIRHVRQLSLDLRPPLLDEMGLAAALRGYLEATAQRSGIEVAVEAAEAPAGIPAEIEITAFRVVQEAVTNVLRHARASRIEVSLTHDSSWLEVSVRDDGRGFDVESALERGAGGHHLGLLGIRERVESLGGTVDLRSAPGVGTSVRVRVPLGE